MATQRSEDRFTMPPAFAKGAPPLTIEKAAPLLVRRSRTSLIGGQMRAGRSQNPNCCRKRRSQWFCAIMRVLSAALRSGVEGPGRRAARARSAALLRRQGAGPVGVDGAVISVRAAA